VSGPSSVARSPLAADRIFRAAICCPVDSSPAAIASSSPGQFAARSSRRRSAWFSAASAFTDRVSRSGRPECPTLARIASGLNASTGSGSSSIGTWNRMLVSCARIAEPLTGSVKNAGGNPVSAASASTCPQVG
jgi:hypothetical protein